MEFLFFLEAFTFHSIQKKYFIYLLIKNWDDRKTIKVIWQFIIQPIKHLTNTIKVLRIKNRYNKLKCLEWFTWNIFNKLKKAAPRFELGIKDLQSSALPLGHAATQDSFESLNYPTSNKNHSLLIICNGHGEDVIALEIIKRLLKEKRIINNYSTINWFINYFIKLFIYTHELS